MILSKKERTMTFRNSASFGKRMEYWVISLLLKEGYDVFIPVVDDNAVDAILRGPNGKIIEIQIKARSSTVAYGNAALFAGIVHNAQRNNYYFIFYSERMEKIWVMSSEDFIEQAGKNIGGKNAGKRTISFNGKNTKNNTEQPKDRYNKWLVSKDGKHDLSQFKLMLGVENGAAMQKVQ